jgi:hypothetical protein
MQKPFITQPELFVSTNDLDHPGLHTLDDTEGVLDWSKIEPILSSIYGYPGAYWVGVIWAIRSQGDHLKEVAREWSQTSDRYKDGSGFEHAWNQYDPNHPNSVGIGSEIKLAKRFGYKTDFAVTADIFDKQTQQNTSSTDDTWPEPKTLKPVLRKVPAFNLKMLPAALVPFVKDVSERMGQPADFVAIPIMITAAAALGSRWVVCPKAFDKNWRESAVLWGGVVARSGAKKSPCISIATKPIQNIEQSLDREYQITHSFYLSAKKQYDTSAKNSKGSTTSGPAPVEPKRQRAIVQDASYQKVTEMMSESPCGLLGLYDEIAGLIASWDSNGQETARSFYLTAWNGNHPYTVDRIERGISRIERASGEVLKYLNRFLLAIPKNYEDLFDQSSFSDNTFGKHQDHGASSRVQTLLRILPHLQLCSRPPVSFPFQRLTGAFA